MSLSISHVVDNFYSALRGAKEFGKIALNEAVSVGSNYILSLVANPVSLNYLGLAAVHLAVMWCYRDHERGLPLAICAGLTSAFYVNLACLHAFA